MQVPILRNHDVRHQIGVVRFSDKGVLFEFTKDVEFNANQLFNIFGNAAIKIIEAKKNDENIIIKRGELIEFSYLDIPAKIEIPCNHIYGYWECGEECIIYKDKEQFENNFNKNSDDMIKFNYCPICGSKL